MNVGVRTLFLTVLLAFTSNVFAGEITTGLGSCDIGGALRGCEWKPGYCHKPSAPSFYIYDKYSVDIAISQYRAYLSDVDSYNACIANEASKDIDKIADDIVKSAKKQLSDVADDVATVKRNLNSQINLHRR